MKTVQRRYHTNQCIHKVVISVVTKPLQIYVNVNVHDVKTHKIQVLFERRYMGYLQTWLMKKLSLWWKNAYVQCSCIILIILFFQIFWVLFVIPVISLSVLLTSNLKHFQNTVVQHVACEQALQWWRAKQVARERAREQLSRLSHSRNFSQLFQMESLLRLLQERAAKNN